MQKLESKLISDIEISNTVCTADLKQEVDISSFNEYEFLNSNLDLYSCGYIKDGTMIGKVIVFGNGKLISIGTKSPDQSKKELERASHILQKYKLTKYTKIKSNIRNIVARFDLKRKLPIEKLARTIPKSLYEPEQFPALIFRIHGNCTIMLFSSGKGIITGTKSIDEINTTFFEVNQKINN
ncbi:TBP family protein [Nitrosopumilus sp. S4]